MINDIARAAARLPGGRVGIFRDGECIGIYEPHEIDPSVECAGVEYARSVKITVEIDTNKQTIREEFDSWDEADTFLWEMADAGLIHARDEDDVRDDPPDSVPPTPRTEA